MLRRPANSSYSPRRTQRKTTKKSTRPKAVRPYSLTGSSNNRIVNAVERDIQKLGLSDRIRALPGYSAWGSVVPNTIGTLGHMGLNFLTGAGDYHAIEYNSIIKPGNASTPPIPKIVERDYKGNTRITKEEYIMDIYSSTSFANVTFGINPCNSALFPWLSNVAQCYQNTVFTDWFSSSGVPQPTP